MNIGDRVHTPAGPATIVRFHYEPMSLGVRNVRRLAWVIVETDDHQRHVFPPRDITKEARYMTTIHTEPEPTTEPDPTPPPPEPADGDDDTAKLIEWP